MGLSQNFPSKLGCRPFGFPLQPNTASINDAPHPEPPPPTGAGFSPSPASRRRRGVAKGRPWSRAPAEGGDSGDSTAGRVYFLGRSNLGLKAVLSSLAENKVDEMTKVGEGAGKYGTLETVECKKIRCKMLSPSPIKHPHDQPRFGGLRGMLTSDKWAHFVQSIFPQNPAGFWLTPQTDSNDLCRPYTGFPVFLVRLTLDAFPHLAVSFHGLDKLRIPDARFVSHTSRIDQHGVGCAALFRSMFSLKRVYVRSAAEKDQICPERTPPRKNTHFSKDPLSWVSREAGSISRQRRSLGQHAQPLFQARKQSAGNGSFLLGEDWTVLPFPDPIAELKQCGARGRRLLAVFGLRASFNWKTLGLSIDRTMPGKDVGL